MTSTITTLIVDGISAHSILLDSYVVLHAALVSSLHKLIGVEFGMLILHAFTLSCPSLNKGIAAFFIQHVVANHEKHFAAYQDVAPTLVTDSLGTEDPQGKETSNLIVLLSELYNFQVVSCLLVYDIIRGLLASDLTEFKVELLLKITRSTRHSSTGYHFQC